jgi:PAS domain S-box-containing protein
MPRATPAPADVLRRVAAVGPPGTPVTTPEVAAGFDCTRRTVYNRLDTLAEGGTLATKKVGANGRVWWRPVADDGGRPGSEGREVQSLSPPVESEMADRIRAFDWRETPLGPVAEWPPELRFTLDVVLSASEAFAVYWGEDLTLLYNDAWGELIGDKHPAALGRPGREVFPEVWETVGPTFEDVLDGKGGTVERGRRLPLKRDGRPEDAWFDYSLTPIPTADGSVGGVLNVAVEVTERKRLERDLRAETEKLDVAVANAPLILFRQDTDLRYTWYRNPHDDFEDVDVLGKRDDEVLPPDAAETVRAPKRRALETGERVREEVTYDLSDEEKTYDLTVDPIRDDTGTVTGVTCAAFDVTERKATEEKLARQAELDAFRVELADALRPLSDPVEVQHTAARVLGERLGVDRAHYAEVLDDGRTNRIHADYYRENGRSVVGEHDFDDYGAYIGEAFWDGDTVVVDDYRTRSVLSEAERETHDRTEVTAWVGVPLYKGGDLSAYFAVTESDARTWTDEEVAMVEETAERTWAAVERARAEQTLREREAALDRLNDATQELIGVGSGTIADRVAPLVRAVLDVEYAALWRYDDRTGDLGEYAVDAAGDVDAGAVTTSDEAPDPVWETFVGGGVAAERDDARPAGPLESRAFVSLGRHGVVCLGATRSDAFDERTVDLAETVAATVEAAWDRAETEAELARQNEELTRLDRLNTLIRRIDQALVAADTREEIDEAVCERLAESDLYEFAWIGDSNPGTDVVHPRTWAGVDGAYVEDLTIAADGQSTGGDPVARAANTGDPQVVGDIATDSSVAPWREATLERGARSLACIPLVYDGSLYGVLSVYADRPGAAARDHEVLSELGDTIAHAVGARETRATLGTDSVVELTLRLPEAETPLPRLARAARCPIDYQGFVRRADGDTDLFFVTRGDAATDLAAVAERSVVVTSVESLAERSEGALFRARVTDPTLAARFTDAGAVVRSMAVDADAATVVLDLPHTAAVREFLDRVRGWTPVELRARNLRERPLRTRQTFAAALDDRLTDRQREVLQTAYLSGYFETPRASTGGEVADLVGVSQPTFSEHLRAAERALCAVLFEDDRGPGEA